MAASTVEKSPVPFSPEEVGDAFAKQYYQILEKNLSLAYRFYEEGSKLGRPENGGSMSLTTTMKGIDEKLHSYGSLKVDVKSVDAQASHNEGVIVLITGYMINPDISRRAFTQTFFLAPQEKGYFILNDIFRYVEDVHISQHDDCIAPSNLSEEEAFPVQENHSSKQSSEEASNLSENGEVLVKEGKEEEEEEPVAVVFDEAPNESEEEEQVAVAVDEAPNESDVVVKSSYKVKEVPKKSYASIVMNDSAARASFPSLQISVPKTEDRQPDVPPDPSSVKTVPSSNSDVDSYENNQEDKGDGHSVYVRNLPINVSYAVVEEEFKRFGPIKSNGIQILVNNGFCYGFVEFEDAGAARSAMQASPFIIGQKEVGVEEKKSKRGFSRGRGGVHRYEDSRGGRESYGGGRGYYGHGERNNYNFSSRGAGGNQGYQYSGYEEEYGGGGYMNRGGGRGFAVSRAQRVFTQS